MADFVFNIAKGRVVEYYNRVESNDPTNSALIIVAINAGAATDATLKDYDSLQAILDDVNAAEVTNTNYARKTLTETDLAALPAPDDTNDRFDVDLPDQTWTSVAAGTAWTDILVCYDSDTTAGVDSAIIPLVCLDGAVTPDGNNITAQFNASGFFRAS
jgi:hypothetical protein